MRFESKYNKSRKYIFVNILNYMMRFCKNAKSFKFCDKKSTELLKLSAFVISKFRQQ